MGGPRSENHLTDSIILLLLHPNQTCSSQAEHDIVLTTPIRCKGRNTELVALVLEEQVKFVPAVVNEATPGVNLAQYDFVFISLKPNFLLLLLV